MLLNDCDGFIRTDSVPFYHFYGNRNEYVFWLQPKHFLSLVLYRARTIVIMHLLTETSVEISYHVLKNYDKLTCQSLVSERI